MVYITDSNYTPLIQVITWYTLAAAVCCVIARAFTKAAVIHHVNLDDYLLWVALFFAIGHMAALLVEASHGLGKPQALIASSDISIILKGDYAANILYVASLCFVKVSVLSLIRLITPVQQHQIAAVALEVLVVAWAVSGIFAIAFQCHLPAPWDFVNSTCIDRIAFWNYFEAMNAATDASMILLPAFIVTRVRTSINRKFAVVGFFGIRISTIAATICKLVYLNRLALASDVTLTSWPVVVCTAAVQCTSIVSACALYLRPFLELLQSGFLNLDDLRRRGVMNPFTLASTKPFSNMVMTSVDDVYTASGQMRLGSKPSKDSVKAGAGARARAGAPADARPGAGTRSPSSGDDPSDFDAAGIFLGPDAHSAGEGVGTRRWDVERMGRPGQTSIDEARSSPRLRF